MKERPPTVDRSTDDEVAVLRDLLSAHRSMVLGALHANAQVDVDSAFQIHAGLSKILASWDEFNVGEQREIVAMIQYFVDSDDDIPDLQSPDGFLDDLAELHRLQVFLGYR